MRIANPIYDAVFKFLMEDAEIARGFLSVIIGEEIEVLEMRPQETAVLSPAAGIGILRYDFKALIRTNGGGHKKILIELQKAKHMLDIMRFRRYLGENYRQADDYLENGAPKSAPLDIVTVYLLGFRLDNVPYAVLKSNNCYQDVLTGKHIEEAVKEPFVNLLDHEAYFIQIPRLQPSLQTRLEEVLLVFNQDNRGEDAHELHFTAQTNDPLVERMIKRLAYAIADEDVQRMIEAEEEIENLLLQKEREIELATRKAEENARKAEENARKAEENAEKLALLQQKLKEKGIDPEKI